MTMRDEAARSKALQGVTVVNGAAYDGTALTGEEIDRIPGGEQKYYSAKVIAETGSGTAGDVVVLKVFTADTSGGAFTELTGSTVTLNEAAEFDTLDLDLSGAKRYIQVQSAAADNTVSTTIDLSCVVLLTGAADNPCSDG